MSNTTMNETKHTPWRTEVLASTLRVVDAEGNDIALIGDCRREDNQSHAQLIAAAPDLLAYVIATRDERHRGGFRTDIADALIAKATGSQTAPQPTGDRVPDDVIDWDGPDREQP